MPDKPAAPKNARLPVDDAGSDVDEDGLPEKPDDTRDLNRGHDSRVDELSEEHATHPVDMAQPWVRPSSLAAPEPREGKVQRWIRISLRGAEDPRNFNMRTREGWRPRPADTIGEDFAFMGTKSGMEEGRLIVDDLMLCEMPREMYKQRAAYYDSLTNQQMDAVEYDLEGVQVQGHQIVKTHTSSVSHPAPRVVGRRVAPAADE